MMKNPSTRILLPVALALLWALGGCATYADDGGYWVGGYAGYDPYYYHDEYYYLGGYGYKKHNNYKGRKHNRRKHAGGGNDHDDGDHKDGKKGKGDSKGKGKGKGGKSANRGRDTGGAPPTEVNVSSLPDDGNVRQASPGERLGTSQPSASASVDPPRRQRSASPSPSANRPAKTREGASSPRPRTRTAYRNSSPAAKQATKPSAQTKPARARVRRNRSN